METVLASSVVLAALIAWVMCFLMPLLSKRHDDDETDLDKVSKFIYNLNDPDVLMELAVLTDVRRLLLHMELTEGRQRIG